jgi:hypothetical protein
MFSFIFSLKERFVDIGKLTCGAIDALGNKKALESALLIGS